MKKNTASQVVGAQMVSASDGSAFTGSVTCYVTGDGGTQSAGSVGSGACTHEGNGFHTYAPAQAETNYDHVAFTFTGTGAIPVTVQVYTTFPQTGDSYARIGAPAGASVSADIAALPTAAENRAEMDSNSTQLAAIVADTNELQTDDVPGLIAALNDPTAAAIADAVLDEALSGHTTAGTLGKAIADIETDATAILADTGTDGVVVASIAANAVNASALATDAVNEIVDQVWTEAIADHSGTAGSTAEALNAAGAAGDPWTTTLPGSYTGSQAGKILSDVLTDTGTTIPATLTTLSGYVDTEVAAIKAVTDNLPDSGALTSLATAAALATVDTVVDAIKVKTDSLTFTAAGNVDANIQYVNDVQVTGNGTSGNEWGPA